MRGGSAVIEGLILGIGIGFLIGFRLCAHMDKKHMERMWQIWHRERYPSPY